MKNNLLLLLAVIVLAVIPLIIQPGAEFSGADGQAEEAIQQISPSYEPWFHAIWEPPSGEIESLLFALQAAIGAGFIGYFIGFMKGKSHKKENQQEKVFHAAD